MKTRNYIRTASQVSLILVLFMLLASSCYRDRGRDGRPGYAYLALTWIDDQPEYIDAGNNFIPDVFEYGRDYHAYPGFYNLYYEGFVYNGHGYSKYAWEMDYEIYELDGEHAHSWDDGRDAPDVYFTLEMGPGGPYYYHENIYKHSMPQGSKLVEQDDTHIVLEQKKDGFGMRVTYRKVAPRGLAVNPHE